jgi:RimJ/RimL family protein N-acetyltransferase
MTFPELRTARLVLRSFEDRDLAPFAAVNADPRVMEYLPAVLSRAESDAAAVRVRKHAEEHGFGLFAVELPRHGLIGFTGLTTVTFEAHFTPSVEIGWRLAAAHWGQGYATEAARAVLTFGFHQLSLPEIVSFTVPHNHRSRRVMEKIVMHHDPKDDFDHPGLPEGHRLRRHVLYRIDQSAFNSGMTDPRSDGGRAS